MADVLVRELDEGIVAGLEERAASNGTGVSEEIRRILRDAAVALPRMSEGKLLELMARCRAMTPPGPCMSSEDLIREDRDSR